MLAYLEFVKILLLTLPEGKFKPHYGNQDFYPLTNEIFFIVIIQKTHYEIEIAPLQSPLSKWE